MSMEERSAPAGRVRVRRAYAAPDGGRRVLVDRLWPRGVAKTDLELAEWARDVAPSAPLRRWFHGGGGTWAEFRRRYRHELASSATDAPGDGPSRAALDALVSRWREEGPGEDLVLVYAAKDEQRNHALVLAEAIRAVL